MIPPASPFSDHLLAAVRRVRITETQILLGLACAVGISAGLGAVAFRELISLFTWLFFTRLYPHLHALGRWALILIPALGALLDSPLIRYFAPEARGHGVPRGRIDRAPADPPSG
jgi:CIC family chloride channel protein